MFIRYCNKCGNPIYKGEKYYNLSACEIRDREDQRFTQTISEEGFELCGGCYIAFAASLKHAPTIKRPAYTYSRYYAGNKGGFEEEEEEQE